MYAEIVKNKKYSTWPDGCDIVNDSIKVIPAPREGCKIIHEAIT